MPLTKTWLITNVHGGVAAAPPSVPKTTLRTYTCPQSNVHSGTENGHNADWVDCPGSPFQGTEGTPNYISAIATLAE